MDFSIVVPTFQRPAPLRACVDALNRLHYPADSVEILIVNDGGNLPSPPPSRLPLRVLQQQNRGPGAARNLGARHAAGRWLAFTDDDCLPHPQWLTELAAALAEASDVLCGGHTRNELTENACSATSQLIVDAAYRYFNPNPARGRFLASNNMAVWREPFLAAGGFDERFRIASEDRELTARWASRHGRIVWIPTAIVGHAHHLNLSRFLRQHFRYGQGAALFHNVRRRQGARLWDDVSFRTRAADLLLKPALATRHPLRTLGLLALWQLANTAGFLRGLTALR